MRTRSIDARPAHAHIATAAAVALVVALVAWRPVQAQETPPRAPALVAAVEPIDPAHLSAGRVDGKAVEPAGGMTPQSSATALDSTIDQATISVTVNAPARRSEAWDGFRRSVASAATPSCFGPEALPHEEFEAQGLLRLPLLAHVAATGACR